LAFPRAGLWVEDASSSVELVHRFEPQQNRDIVHLVDSRGEMEKPIPKTVLLKTDAGLGHRPVRKGFNLPPQGLEAHRAERRQKWCN
jgi:hypothetical protein